MNELIKILIKNKKIGAYQSLIKAGLTLDNGMSTRMPQKILKHYFNKKV